jgi:hypothetical protein
MEIIIRNKITAHIGTEEADGLAGLGSKSDYCEPKLWLDISKALMTRITEEWLIASISFYMHLSNSVKHKNSAIG